MAKAIKDGGKDKVGKENGKVEVEVEGRSKAKANRDKDNNIARRYMHMDPIYLLRKLGLVVRF